jgi:hypothetical protein
LQRSGIPFVSIMLAQEVVACIPDRVGINPTQSWKEMKRCKCCYLTYQLRTTPVVLICNNEQKKGNRKSITEMETNLQVKHSSCSNTDL